MIITQPIFTNLVNGQINAKKNWTLFYHQELYSLFTKNTTDMLWEKYNQLHPQGEAGQNTTVLTYDLLALSLPPTAMIATVV